MRYLKGTKIGCFMNNKHSLKSIQGLVSSLRLAALKTNLKIKKLTPNPFNSAFMKRLRECKPRKGKKRLRKTKYKKGAKKHALQTIHKIEQYHSKQTHNLWGRSLDIH